MNCRAIRRRVRLALLLAAAAMAGGCLEPSPVLEAAFVADPNEGPSPLVVQFDASGSYAEGGAIVAYGWDFGDGSDGTGMTPAHIYTSDVERTHTMVLTVTDNEGRHAEATGEVTVSPPAPGSPAETIEFVWPFHYDASGEDAAALNDEYFTLENTGTQPADLTGWSVSNEHGDTFEFPDGFTLAPGAIVMIHSGAGTNTEAILYWNAAAPVWNNTTDIAILYNALHDIVDVYAYASC